MKAAAKGHLAVVQYLLEQGVELHFENDFALRLAASNGHLALVEFLVERGANLHAQDEYALVQAAEGGHLEIVRYLVGRGADIHAENGMALRLAATSGNLEVVEFLLGLGADLHVNEEEALKMALNRGHLEVVKTLVKRGAYFLDTKVFNAAVLGGHFQAVEFLLEQGADEIITDEYLDFLLRTKNFEVTNLFFSYNLRIKEKTPKLIVKILRLNLVKKNNVFFIKSELLRTYRRKLLPAIVYLLRHLFYRPGSPVFFQAVEVESS